jgi:hypothetical protein
MVRQGDELKDEREETSPSPTEVADCLHGVDVRSVSSARGGASDGEPRPSWRITEVLPWTYTARLPAGVDGASLPEGT